MLKMMHMALLNPIAGEDGASACRPSRPFGPSRPGDSVLALLVSDRNRGVFSVAVVAADSMSSWSC